MFIIKAVLNFMRQNGQQTSQALKVVTFKANGTGRQHSETWSSSQKCILNLYSKL